MFDTWIRSKQKSVYKIAKESAIPYTTLNELLLGKKDPADCNYRTIAALAAYFDVPSELLLAGGRDHAAVPATNWEDARKKRYRFPLVARKEELSCGFALSRIHPLKQREVLAVQEALRNDPRVGSVYVFGSSCNIRCRRGSDIDLAVDLRPEHRDVGAKNEISEAIQKVCDYQADIVWMDRVKSGSRLKNSVARGVRIV